MVSGCGRKNREISDPVNSSDKGVSISSTTEALIFYPCRHWRKFFIITNLALHMYELGGSVSTYRAASLMDKAFELKLAGTVSYVLPIRGLLFSPPWSLGVVGILRNQWFTRFPFEMKWSPFIGAQMQFFQIASFALVANSSVVSFQSESLNIFWATVGIRFNGSFWNHWVDASPYFSLAPYTSATLNSSGGSLSHTGWKCGLRASGQIRKSFYGGTDLQYLTLEGDSQISSSIGQLFLGFAF